MSAKSSGPLPRHGGRPSKSYYSCQICKKEIRRDKVKEHLVANVDMDVLGLVPGLRGQPLARLTSDKRNHTEKVHGVYDKHEQLPIDYRNTEFWIQAMPSKPSSSGMLSNFLVKKPSSSGLLGPPAKKAAVDSGYTSTASSRP